MLPWRSGHWRQALRARAVAATRFASCQKVLPHLGLVPRAVRVAVLWNSSIQAKVAEWKDTQEPARSVGLTLRSFEARSPEELDGVLAAIGHDLPDALLTFTDGFMIALRHPLDRILFEQCSNLIECHVRRMSTRRSARQPRGTCRARSRRTRSSRPYRRRLAASLTNVAVCLLPGTEIAFDKNVECQPLFDIGILPSKKIGQRLARFRQTNMDNAVSHHDALEFPDGQVVLLTRLCEGQRATVLQLPAAAHPAAEEVARPGVHEPSRSR